MPIVKKTYIHENIELNSTTSTTAISMGLPYKISYKYSTDGGDTVIDKQRNLSYSSSNYNYMNKEIQQYFYNDLKDLFSGLDLDISFDDENNLITIFGVKLFCCIAGMYYSSNLYGQEPVLDIYEKRYDNAYGSVKSYSSDSGFSSVKIDDFCKLDNIYNSSNKTYTLKLNLYYNTDYIRITYTSQAAITEEYPIIFMMKCKNNINNRDMVYVATDCNCDCTQINAYQTINWYGAYAFNYLFNDANNMYSYPGRHLLIYPDNPYEHVLKQYTSSGLYTYNALSEDANVSKCALFGINILRKFASSVSSFVYKKVTALDDSIEFSNNMIYANENLLTMGETYKINNELYIYPTNYYNSSQDNSYNTAIPYLRTTFLLKL